MSVLKNSLWPLWNTVHIPMNDYWVLVISDHIKTHPESRLDLNTLLAGSVIDNQTRDDCAAYIHKMEQGSQQGGVRSRFYWRGHGEDVP